MNLMIYLKDCLYIVTHLWAIVEIDPMLNGGIRIWFAIANGEYGIPTNWITFVGLVMLACYVMATLIEIAANVLVNLIALGVEMYKTLKKSDGTLV